MRRRIVPRLSYANVMATVAVFLALGGSSYAALKVTGKQVRDGSLTGRDIRDNSVRSRDIRNRTLLARDFKPGQLRGIQGPGDPGMWSIRRDARPGFQFSRLPALPGLAGVAYVCQEDNPATGRLYLENTSGQPLSSVATVTELSLGSSTARTEIVRDSVAAGGSTALSMFEGVTQVVWQIGHASDADDGTLATLTVTHIADSGCHLSVSATYQAATVPPDEG